MKNLKTKLTVISSSLFLFVSFSNAVKAQDLVDPNVIPTREEVERDAEAEIEADEEAGVGTENDLEVEVDPETGNVRVTEQDGEVDVINADIDTEEGNANIGINGEVVVDRSLNGLEGFLRSELPGVLTFVESIFGPISLAEIPDIIKSGELVFNQNGTETVDTGVQGLPNPQLEANRTSTSEEYGNPETVEEVDQLAQASDATQSQIVQGLSQVIFGEVGQEDTVEQNEYLEETQNVAINSIESTLESYGTSLGVNENQINLVEAISVEAENAREARASQDILKALATQEEYQAQIQAGISEQVSILNGAAVANAAQMQGINTQLSVLNKREQNIQTFLGAQNLQLSEIDNNLEQQIELDKYRERQENSQEQVRPRLVVFGIFNDEDSNIENEDSDI